jgi:ribonuclease E
LGGYIFIQQTEALTVVDVNSGKFTSSASQAETILKTNLQAADEIARQLKLRNIGGMIIVDFIDMNNRMDKLAVLEHFELALEKDKAKPQIGQLSDLGLVELTRHRQGQSLAEVFTKKCDKCSGSGFLLEDFKIAAPTSLGERNAKMSKIKGPFGQPQEQKQGDKGQGTFQKFNKRDDKDKHQKHQRPHNNNSGNKPQHGQKMPQMDLETIEKELAPILETVPTPALVPVFEGETQPPTEPVEFIAPAEIIEAAAQAQAPQTEDGKSKDARKPSRKAKKHMKKEGAKSVQEPSLLKKRKNPLKKHRSPPKKRKSRHKSL